MQHYVGIDVSKKDFYACFNEQDEPIKFNNDHSGIRNFIKYLGNSNYLIGNTVIGVESTGAYHLPLSLGCSQNGYTIKVINPLITKKQNQTNLRLVKNDKQDSRLIRHCLTTGVGYPFHETNASLVLKNLVRQRDYLADTKRRFNLKQQDVEYKEKYLKFKISTVNIEIALIIAEKIKLIEKELRKYNTNTQKLLRSIPGIGPITAVSFISEIGDIKRFKNDKQLTAYIGLDSRVYQSGTSILGKGYISKRGNKILRTRLFNATSVAVLHPNIFQSFFQKKKSEGKPYRVALVATMHKMVKVVFAVWTRNTPFVTQLPITYKEG